MTKLGYGLAKLPIDKYGNVDKIKSIQIIEDAIHEGIDIFDTSPFYLNGKSEEIIGEVISNTDKQIEISTKTSLKEFNNKEEFFEKFEKQLKRLKREYIDYYLIHGFDRQRLKKFNDLETWNWLKQLKEGGKIKNIGFSFHGDINLLKEIINLYNWDVCMIKFSPLDKYFETGEEGIKYVNSKNVKIFLIQPYFGGVYTELINSYERKKGLFYKIWNTYNIQTVFVGTRNTANLIENINIMKDYNKDKKVEEIIQEFEEFEEDYTNNKIIRCDGCDACNICSKNIAIPYIFMIYNIFKITKNEEKFVYNYENVVKKHGNFRKRV